MIPINPNKDNPITTPKTVINVKEDNRLFGRLILMFEAAFRSP